VDPGLTLLTLRIRFCETDLMGIVHHANYLQYFEAGRVEWLRRRGVTYADWARRGIHLPVVDAQLRYRAPAHFDDLISIETRLTALRSHSLRYDYVIFREATKLAEGSTRLACVDGKHALMQIPEDVEEVLRGPEVTPGDDPNSPTLR
jgi:acyl-CoA thioester hydrolase